MSIPQQVLDRHDDPAANEHGFERVPPQDLDAEQCVLGGMLLSKNAIGDVIEALSGGTDFYRPAHETIYNAIVGMYAKGEPADPITVAAELSKRGEIERVGGAPYLHTLVHAVPTAATAAWYAERVAECALWRGLVEAGTRIVQEGYAAEGEAKDALDRAQADLLNVANREAGQDALPLGDTAEAMLDRIENRKAQGTGMRGLPTGFADLNSLTRGFVGGQLIVIAGRPAMGKSTVAIDIAREVSIERGIPAAFFSLEMGREEIEERILSAQARVGHHLIQSGEVDDDGWARIANVLPKIAASPFYIDDTENSSFMEIAAKARRYRQKYGIELIVIDYLQLMSSGGRRTESRQQEVSEISRNLKLLAKSLNVPVIALSQLNRGPEQRSDKKPVLSDLRESGAIEQDADIVILLHREDAYEKESPRAGEADLIVAKHRGGPTATVTVAFQGHYSRFVDMARNV